MKEKIKKAEAFIMEAKELGLEPNLFNLLNYLEIKYKWDTNEKQIIVDKKSKMLLEFLKMMLQKYFPRKGGSDTEDSPM